MRRVVFFTKYTTKGPSSRYRTYQYDAFLSKHFSIEYFSFFDDTYIDKIYANQPISKLYLLKVFLNRFFQILKKIGTKDLIVIEYELIPYFPSFFEKLLKLTGVKYMLDYDDAIFHNYENSSNFLIRFLLKNKIKNIAKGASHIITGSPYLTSYFKKYNENTTEIPTSIVFQNYSKHKQNTFSDKFIIGWLGSNSTAINLLKLKEVIAEMSKIYPNVVFKFCGFDTRLERYFGENVVLVPWTTENEMKFLNEISLGIMPLEDNYFNRGKCGFKLIQYMAMGKPTISSPLEANVKINRSNENLFATTEQEWSEAFGEVLSNIEKYNNVGIKNIDIIKKYYSVEENSKIYVELFKSI